MNRLEEHQSEEREDNPSITEKIKNMANEIEDSWNKLSEKKKKVVRAVTAGMFVVGATALIGGMALTSHVSPTLTTERENSAEVMGSQIEFSNIQESSKELENLIENAQEVAYYATSRAGYSVVPTFVEDGKLVVFDDLVLHTDPKPGEPGSWISEVDDMPTRAPILAIKTTDGQKRAFILTSYGLEEGVDLGTVAETIIELDDGGEIPGAELVLLGN